jgi:TRAP transporter TAXI family solute receptor
MRFTAAKLTLPLLILVGLAISATGQAQTSSKAQTGYAVKKPVFGGACPTCPWGEMGEIVREAMKKYGWDIQMCYFCAGGPREARMVAGAMMPVQRGANPENLPLPNGPVDFGATGSQFLQWAYLGIHDFAKDKEGPRKNLRVIAHIQEPTYFVVAVKADSTIKDLGEIVEKKLPVKIMASTSIGGSITPSILSYFGITSEKMKSQGGELRTDTEEGPNRKSLDVVIGFGSMVNAPEYNMWYELSQRENLRYLEIPAALRAKLAKDFYLTEVTMPQGYFHGMDRPIQTLGRTGTVIYGRDDMPDEFAYTLAKAMDEQQELLQWSSMNFSYNWRTVWKAFDVPLHPGAAKYYREVHYMK